MAKEPKQALTYEPATSSMGVTRRQFRLLLILIFLHLAITVQSTYAPGISNQLRQAWAEHKQKVAEQAAQAAAVRQQLALEQQCCTFTQPVSTVVWEEDPERAATLLQNSGYRAAPVECPQADVSISILPPMAMAVEPPLLNRLLPDFSLMPLVSQSRGSGPNVGASGWRGQLVFLHRLTSPAGHARLAGVFFAPAMEVTGLNTYSGGDDDGKEEGKLSLTRAFAAATWSLSNGQSPPETLFQSWALDLNPVNDPLIKAFLYSPPPRASGQQGLLKLEDFDKLRLFTGQPDPADGSHFTMAYELGGRRGIIDGFLRDDDTIHLVPRDGKVVGGRWYPEAK